MNFFRLGNFIVKNMYKVLSTAMDNSKKNKN